MNYKSALVLKFSSGKLITKKDLLRQFQWDKMDNLLILSLLLSFQNSSYILKRQYWRHFFFGNSPLFAPKRTTSNHCKGTALLFFCTSCLRLFTWKDGGLQFFWFWMHENRLDVNSGIEGKLSELLKHFLVRKLLHRMLTIPSNAVSFQKSPICVDSRHVVYNDHLHSKWKYYFSFLYTQKNSKQRGNSEMETEDTQKTKCS